MNIRRYTYGACTGVVDVSPRRTGFGRRTLRGVGAPGRGPQSFRGHGFVFAELFSACCPPGADPGRVRRCLRRRAPRPWIRQGGRGASFSILQATVQAWQPTHVRWSMTKPYFATLPPLAGPMGPSWTQLDAHITIFAYTSPAVDLWFGTSRCGIGVRRYIPTFVTMCIFEVRGPGRTKVLAYAGGGLASGSAASGRGRVFGRCFGREA
jgi:hypothetical protein